MQRFISAVLLFLVSLTLVHPTFGDDKKAAAKSKAMEEFRAGLQQGFLSAQLNHSLTDMTLKRFEKAKLTADQKVEIDVIAFEFADAIVENELKASLTPRQKGLRDAVRIKAFLTGTKGKELDAAIAKAIVLTREQQAAQAEIKKLKTQFAIKTLDLLTAEQKRLLRAAAVPKPANDPVAEASRAAEEKRRLAAAKESARLAKIAAEAADDAKLTAIEKQKVLSTLGSPNPKDLEVALRMLAKKSRRSDDDIARALAPLCDHSNPSFAKLADLALAKYSPSHFLDYGYRNRVELKASDLGAKVTAETPMSAGLIVAVKAKFRSGWFAAKVASLEGDYGVGVIFQGESHVVSRTRKDLYLPPDGVSQTQPLPEGTAKPQVESHGPQELVVNTLPPQMRTWTDSTGKLKVEAQFVAFENDTVRLQRKDGRKVQVPLDRLSQADQQFVQAKRAAVQAKRTTGPAADSAVNLLALIDAKKHRTRGTWKWESDVLVGSGVANIFVPYAPPSEYEIKLVVERVQGKRCILMGLIAPNGKDFNVFIDAYNGSCSGIGMYNGKDVNSDDNPTAIKGQVLEDFQKTTIVYTVRQDRLKVSVNGEAIVDFQPDYELVKRHWAWSMPRHDWLYIAINHCTFRISEMSLTPF